MSQTAEDTTRRTLIVAIGVALLLVAAIAIAAARGASPEPVAASTSEAPAAPKPSDDATRSDASVAGTAPVTAQQGSKPAVPGKKNAKPAPGKGKAEPVAPAKVGSALTTLTAPPEKTIGMIVVPKGFSGGKYSITFKPFGWGPAGPDGGRLVAQIVSATASDSGAKSLDKDFGGRNATLWCGPEIAKAIKLGGSYAGTMMVRPQGDVGVLYLTEAKASK